MTSFVRDSKTENFPKLRKILLPGIASLLGTMIVLFPSNPGNMSLPSRDSGVFFYVGWRMLKGDVPYRDVWDHKPPLIYFVDALGLALSPNSLWGVWFLQFIFIFLTLFLIFRSLENILGFAAAVSGTIMLTSGLLTVIDRGNVTEGYALLFQAFCFWLFIKSWKQDFPVRDSFWIGLCGGLAFNFKQTTIGILLTYGLVLLVVRFWHRKLPLGDLLSLLAGWLLPTLLLAAYLASQNALSDFWKQAFLYNIAYIGKHEGVRRLIPVFIKGFFLLRNGWVLYFAVAGWLAGLGYAWFTRKDLLTPAHSLILIALVNLPLEVILITVAGRSIIHYYLTILPVMAILAGALTYTVPFLLGRIPGLESRHIQKWIPGILLALVSIGQISQVQYYPQYIRDTSRNGSASVIDYVAKNTQADDKVLIIGAESAINFLTRRESPTRYVYQYPLALTGSRPMFEEYFNQILENKPVLIIDTRGRKRLDEQLYVPLQKRSQIVRDGVRYLAENYEQVAQFRDWFIYRLAEK